MRIYIYIYIYIYIAYIYVFNNKINNVNHVYYYNLYEIT